MCSAKQTMQRGDCDGAKDHTTKPRPTVAPLKVNLYFFKRYFRELWVALLWRLFKSSYWCAVLGEVRAETVVYREDKLQKTQAQ